MKLNLVAFFTFLFALQNSYSQHTDVINSNRPSESISAFAVGKTVIQLESGLSYVNEKHSLLDYKSNGFVFDFNLRYGFLKEQLEFMTDLSYQNDNYTADAISTKRTGIKSTTLGLKYLVYDPYKNYEEQINVYSWKANHKFKWRQLIPAVSVYGGMNLNFTNNPFIPEGEKISVVSPKAMLVTQNIFGNGYVLISNIFIDKLSTPRESVGYILTLTKGFNDKWSAFFENKAIKSELYADGIFSGGAAYLLTDNLQVDASLSKNYKDTPSLFYAGFGVSWRSDTNYKDVMVRAKKDKKKKDKSTKGKEKDKTKKRLDEIEIPKP